MGFMVKWNMEQAYTIKEQVPQRVIILRALQLGDLLCAVPAFRALRTAFPQAEISLIGLPWASNFVNRFNIYLDKFIEFPGYPGLPEQYPQIDKLPEFLRGIQHEEYHLAVQMQGSGAITNSLVSAFGAANSAGFYLPGQYCPDEETYLVYPVNEPEVIRHLSLMDYLGIPAQGTHLEFPITEHDWSEFSRLREMFDFSTGDYICIHPGARVLDRRWPADRFAEVGDALARRGFRIILTGSQEEQHLTRLVASHMKIPPLDVAGRTDLGTLAILLSGARLVICNDTGVSHLSDAVKAPSVVLFSASDPNRWAPLDQELHRIIRWASAAPPQVVLEEAEVLLGRERAYAVG